MFSALSLRKRSINSLLHSLCLSLSLCFCLPERENPVVYGSRCASGTSIQRIIIVECIMYKCSFSRTVVIKPTTFLHTWVVSLSVVALSPLTARGPLLEVFRLVALAAVSLLTDFRSHVSLLIDFRSRLAAHLISPQLWSVFSAVQSQSKAQLLSLIRPVTMK